MKTNRSIYNAFDALFDASCGFEEKVACLKANMLEWEKCTSCARGFFYPLALVLVPLSGLAFLFTALHPRLEIFGLQRIGFAFLFLGLFVSSLVWTRKEGSRYTKTYNSINWDQYNMYQAGIISLEMLCRLRELPFVAGPEELKVLFEKETICAAAAVKSIKECDILTPSSIEVRAWMKSAVNLCVVFGLLDTKDAKIPLKDSRFPVDKARARWLYANLLGQEKIIQA